MSRARKRYLYAFAESFTFSTAPSFEHTDQLCHFSHSQHILKECMHVQAVAKGAVSVSKDQQCLCSARLFECLTKCVDLDDMSLMWKGICANLTRAFHSFGAKEAAKQVVSLSSMLTSHPSVRSSCIAFITFPSRALPPSLRFHLIGMPRS